MRPPAARTPTVSLEGDGTPQETCVPSSFDLCWLSFSTLRISEPSALLPFPILAVSLVRGPWFWKCVSAGLVGCVLGLLCPHKGLWYCFCWAGRGLWEEPHHLGRIVGGSDGEQRFCECPRRILAAFRYLTGAGSRLESSSRGCSCLQAPDRPHVLSGS